jgi:hypothetical protein
MNSALCFAMTGRGDGYRRGIVVSLLYLAWALSHSVVAWTGPLDNQVEFHISAGSLADALIEFSTQANIQVALAAHATANLRSPGLTGRLPVTVALETLLRNSGLSYQTVGDTVTIVQTASASPAAGLRPPQSDGAPPAAVSR